MKKIWLILLVAVFLTALIPSARAAEEEAFFLDREAVFSNMDRSYAQGYAPTVAWGRMMLAMPVRSDRAVGGIQAELLIDEAISPFRTPLPAPRIQAVEPGSGPSASTMRSSRITKAAIIPALSASRVRTPPERPSPRRSPP